MKLETKRLILRPPRKSDWKDIVEGVGDINVSRMVSSIPYPYSKKDAMEWINKNIKKWKTKDKPGYSWVIELKKEKKVIGGTGLFNFDSNKINAETGSWINRKYWKHDFITEAKIPVINFAFGKLKLKKLITATFTDNKASNAMSQKLGYKFVGKLRKHEKCKATGKIHDANLYEILKEEWEKIRPKIIKELNKKIKWPP